MICSADAVNKIAAEMAKMRGEMTQMRGEMEKMRGEMVQPSHAKSNQERMIEFPG